ncbi:PAS domain S-box-containing protein [Deinococcus metalli]|uniref:PAS domain S-box-containing protein n=1 Tax=Deinococcus metalli TaxID=1141878 RepID=A0A7W8KEU0_9DEIO|nr:PAS domain-containing protein [Deinococcus metalli]MBB5376605.1 PAS domain S-box-containing protein [Deinococcus metalli]GHF42832.1 hypothetical protein GCM10017781_18970 [Deinococcus metalli]
MGEHSQTTTAARKPPRLRDGPDAPLDEHDRHVWFDASPVGLLFLDGAGTVVQINPAGCALLGRTRAALQGRPLVELVASPEAEHITAFLHGAARVPRTPSVIVDLRPPGGTHRHVQLEVTRSGVGRATCVALTDVSALVVDRFRRPEAAETARPAAADVLQPLERAAALLQRGLAAATPSAEVLAGLDALEALIADLSGRVPAPPPTVAADPPAPSSLK